MSVKLQETIVCNAASIRTTRFLSQNDDRPATSTI